MLKPWKTIIRFALLGLAIAGIAYAYAATHDYTKPMTPPELAAGLISVILCPPQLIFAACIDCEASGWGGFTMYAIVGVLNAALYATVGTVVDVFRKKSD